MRGQPFEVDRGRKRGAETPRPVAIGRVPRPDADNPDEVRIGRQAKLPLSLIAGLPEEAEFDLKRIGVENVESLAVANPIVLLTETTYAFAQIVDWIGEALLLFYFGAEPAEQLRRFGVRTILNLLVACDERPPAAMARILCRSDDPASLSSLAATLHADPLIARLSELQDPGASRIVGTIMEAGAASRGLAAKRASRTAWYDHLLAARNEAYAALSPRERLRAAHPAVLVASALIMVGALAMVWQFGEAALAGVAGAAFPSLPRNAAPVLYCAFAAAFLIIFVMMLRSAFTAPRASHGRYVLVSHVVVLIVGVLLGTAVWFGLGAAGRQQSAQLGSADRQESTRAQDVVAASGRIPRGAGAAKIDPAHVEAAAEMPPPNDAAGGSPPQMPPEAPAEATLPVAGAAPTAEPVTASDAIVAGLPLPSSVSAPPGGAKVDDGPSVGTADPRQRDEPEPPSPLAAAAADPPAAAAQPDGTVEDEHTTSPTRSVEAAGPAAAPAPAVVPAIGVKAAPVAEARRPPLAQNGGKRYFVQFGIYRLLASATSDCAAFAPLVAVTVVPSRIPEIGFYCRTAASRPHAEAMSLVRAVKSTMNRDAMLVADARPVN